MILDTHLYTVRRYISVQNRRMLMKIDRIYSKPADLDETLSLCEYAGKLSAVFTVKELSKANPLSN